MCFRNTLEKYHGGFVLLHWVIALTFIGLFAVAEIMMEMAPGPDKWQLYGLHKSTGLTLITLVLLRILWRLSGPVPAHPAGMSLPQQLAAHGVHLGLYAAMILMPVSGYIMSMAGGYGITWFGVWAVPDLIGENKALGSLAHSVHHYTAWAVYGLFALHVLGALYHHVVQKDDVLTRMLPFLKKS